MHSKQNSPAARARPRVHAEQRALTVSDSGVATEHISTITWITGFGQRRQETTRTTVYTSSTRTQVISRIVLRYRCADIMATFSLPVAPFVIQLRMAIEDHEGSTQRGNGPSLSARRLAAIAACERFQEAALRQEQARDTFELCEAEFLQAQGAYWTLHPHDREYASCAHACMKYKRMSEPQELDSDFDSNASSSSTPRTHN